MIVNQVASHPVGRKQLGDLYERLLKADRGGTRTGHWKKRLVAARSVSPGGGQGPSGQVTSLADLATPD